MTVGVLKETYPGERRVALTPGSVPALLKAGMQIVVEHAAGEASGYSDHAYTEAGCSVQSDRNEIVRQSDILVCVRSGGADPEGWETSTAGLRSGAVVIAMMDPLARPEEAERQAKTGATLIALEMLPRITRAQSMDVLSSQANLAGYKAVLIAANALPKLLPMMMTAAGTITPARIFVIGAGVAGLQAIATAKRLGAVVTAYDVRPAVKEQIESLGARFLELPLDAGEAQGSGGYARAMDAEFYRKQAEVMTSAVAEADGVITTAAVPGKRAPILVTTTMVEQMRPGSVLVDLAAERGGNCELTKPGETVEHHGVSVMGPLNIPSLVPFHASQLFGKNVANLLVHLVRQGEIVLDMEDEITAGALVARGGQVVHEAVLAALTAGRPAGSA